MMGMYVLLDHDGEKIETVGSLAEAARIACDEMFDIDIEIQYEYWENNKKQVSFEGYAGDVYQELGLVPPTVKEEWGE